MYIIMYLKYMYVKIMRIYLFKKKFETLHIKVRFLLVFIVLLFHSLEVYFFLALPHHMEIPGPGLEPVP